MGFISNYYNKPGPGIPKNAPQKKGIKLFFEILFREFFELIKLNLLYILFCIPIVTIPAATTAMSRITVTMVRDQNHFLWTDFWKEFKADFMKSLAAGVLLGLGTFCSFFGVYFYNHMMASSKFFIVPLGISCVIALILIIMGFYLYPMIALVDLPFKQLFKNSFILFVVCLPHNLLTVLVMAVLLFLYVGFFPLSLPVWLVLSFSLFNFITTFCAYAGMKKYIIREDGDDGPGTPVKIQEDGEPGEAAPEAIQPS